MMTFDQFIKSNRGKNHVFLETSDVAVIKMYLNYKHPDTWKTGEVSDTGWYLLGYVAKNTMLFCPANVVKAIDTDTH
jgi:hypothetical protein